MAYDEGLAQRIREILVDQPGLVEKKMFGGIAFMLQGNMVCGVNKEDLIVRLDPAQYEAAVTRAHARPFDLAGRVMKGWVMVGPDGCEADEALEAWVQQGVDFALSLPPK
jgi:hypothetical protein